jgi:hypothetical protein
MNGVACQEKAFLVLKRCIFVFLVEYLFSGQWKFSLGIQLEMT